MRRVILPLALALLFAPALYATGTASISGIVTDTDSAPCEGVAVMPYIYVVSGWGNYWQQALASPVLTDSSGAYTVSGSEAGTYRLQFSDDNLHRYFGEYYDNAANLSSATDVPVADGAVVTGINAQLAKASRIVVTTVKTLSGDVLTGQYYTVTGSEPGFAVEAVSAPGGVVDVNAFPYFGTLKPATDRYEIYDLPPGEYMVRLYDYNYYFTPEETPVTIGSGTTTDVTLTTYKFGSFTGRVTDAAGNPLAGIKVTASSFGQNYPVRTATSDAAGNYNVDGVVASEYTLSFEDPAGRYFMGYYKQPAPGADPALPTPAYASEPDFATQPDGWPEAPGILATNNLGVTSLSPAATISGTVRNSGGTGLGGITVQLYRSNSVTQNFDPVSYTVTAGGAIGPTPASLIVPGGPGGPGGLNQPSPGTYKLGPLEPGDYRIHFFQPYSTLYVPEYYNDKADLASADSITVNAEQQVTGVDAVLAATTSASPFLNVSAAFSAFATTEGSPSAAQTFTVDGSNLTSIIFIAAPAGYEVSSDGSTFGPNVSLTPVSGSVASTTLYVRIAASAAVGGVSGSLELTTAPAVMQTVAVSGTVTSNYDAWADGHVLTGGDRVGTADPDKDGLSNNAEFAFGTNPSAANGALMSFTQSGSNLVITFLARTSGATYKIENTTQLGQTWSDSGISVSDAVDQNNLPANYTRKTATIPISGRAFFRVKAVTN